MKKILKNQKMTISLRQFKRSARNLALWFIFTLWTVSAVKIYIPKNPRWRTATILITVKVLYLRNDSACCREIWYIDTRWPY